MSSIRSLSHSQAQPTGGQADPRVIWSASAPLPLYYSAPHGNHEQRLPGLEESRNGKRDVFGGEAGTPPYPLQIAFQACDCLPNRIIELQRRVPACPIPVATPGPPRAAR